MKAVTVLVLALWALGVERVAATERYPQRPIRLIVPFAPGGGTDILARVLAPQLSAVFGQSVVVDNRAGAGGAIGAELAARAEADGHTVLLTSSSYSASVVYRQPPYDPVNGIEPIILLGTVGLVMVTHPSLPVADLAGLIRYARAHPGKLNYASVGAGSVTHFTHELFQLETRTKLVHVPYKGGGPALAAAVAGEVQLTTISIVPTLPHVKAGRLRALGITTTRRSSLLPEVPAIAEVVPGFEVVHWYGIWGPKGIARGIVLRWNREAARLIGTREMKEQFAAEGLDPAGGPPEEFREVIRRDVARWSRVVREGKLRLE